MSKPKPAAQGLEGRKHNLGVANLSGATIGRRGVRPLSCVGLPVVIDLGLKWPETLPQIGGDEERVKPQRFVFNLDIRY